MRWIVRAVIDDHTPNACLAADGADCVPGDLPHETDEDETNCHCVAEPQE